MERQAERGSLLLELIGAVVIFLLLRATNGQGAE